MAELFEQVHLDEALAGGEPNLTNEALKSLQEFNRQKGWGLQVEDIWKGLEARSELTHNQNVASYITEAKKWFSENEHRFPDWKPGDPLPEVEALTKSEPPESARE